ncbi:hypothetical protein [Bdellovibrio reynosensis]|uniref:Uncharacterized protein n=1 Tax=Bdellovibrio reynosensis TaxID=2835041 RepID=A0ABY4C623_9BACT|nr:hypothetical protein [Bdellovibrio reynosensis]UOF00174.1 hypothetical protein MNR06_10720 [Bdellovibrio reynosensis]
MNMKKKLGIGIALVAVLGGGILLKDRFKTVNPFAAKKSAKDNWADLKRSHSLAVNTHMGSPAGKAWQDRNFTKLLEMFGENKSQQDNRNFFQASIFVLDQINPEWKPEEKDQAQAVQKRLVEYLTADRADVVGEEAKVYSYATKVLIKIGPLADDQLKSLEKFYNHSKNRNQRDVVADALIRSIPLSAAGKSIISNMVNSKNDVTQGLLLVGQVKDPEAQQDLLNQVYKKYTSYPAPLRPMIYKQLVVNHSLIKGDLKKYLKEMAGNKEQEWNDAFLIGVKELDCINDFRSDVERIEKETQYPHIKMLANNILTSGKGAR